MSLVTSYYQTYHLLGSNGEETHEFRNRPPRSQYVALTELDTFLSHPRHRGIHGMDVMEIWGGKGGVSKISIRRCLNTGRNFDLVTGADLTKYHNQQMLLTYVRTHQP